MNKSLGKLLSVIFTAIAAVVWSAACVLDFIYETPWFLQALRILCALAWVIAFLVTLHRYRKSPKE